MTLHSKPEAAPKGRLRRALSRPLLVLYGLGTILGAGIYALIGEVVAEAGALAPLSFLVASAVAALTALSFAELSSRYPKSAGEAIYVSAGFRSRRLPLIVGLFVMATGIVSAAAIARGFVGYAHDFVMFPDWLGMIVLLATLGGLACWGVSQSVSVAAVITVIEAGALVIVIVAGLGHIGDAAVETTLTERPHISLGVIAGAVLAFYAFIGFEDMVNVAEEVKGVRRAMPTAIITVFVVATVLYVAVAFIAVSAFPPAELAGSAAPMALLFGAFTGLPTRLMSAVAMLAVVNGALIQIIMASRVVYGLAREGWLPERWGRVNGVTQTPVTATLAVTALTIAAALTAPIATLAQATSLLVLVVFTLVNLALIRVRRRDGPNAHGFNAPSWTPPVAAATCVLFAGASIYALVS